MLFKKKNLKQICYFLKKCLKIKSKEGNLNFDFQIQIIFCSVSQNGPLWQLFRILRTLFFDQETRANKKCQSVKMQQINSHKCIVVNVQGKEAIDRTLNLVLKPSTHKQPIFKMECDVFRLVIKYCTRQCSHPLQTVLID